jgi:hypothetical protein
MVGAYGKYMRERERETKDVSTQLGWGNLRERSHLENTDGQGKIIVK